MTFEFESVGGELMGSARGKVLQFPTGRVCEEPGCRTRLSVYNSRVRCALHDFDPTLVSVRPPAPMKSVHHLDTSRVVPVRHRHRSGRHVTHSAA